MMENRSIRNSLGTDTSPSFSKALGSWKPPMGTSFDSIGNPASNRASSNLKSAMRFSSSPDTGRMGCMRSVFQPSSTRDSDRGAVRPPPIFSSRARHEDPHLRVKDQSGTTTEARRTRGARPRNPYRSRARRHRTRLQSSDRCDCGVAHCLHTGSMSRFIAVYWSLVISPLA